MEKRILEKLKQIEKQINKKHKEKIHLVKLYKKSF